MPSPGFARITFTRGAQALVDGSILNANNVVAILGAVAEAATGTDGIFASHLRQRQGAWPQLSSSWANDPRKQASAGAGRKFVFSGRVERTITQTGIRSRATVLNFGSSADIYASVGSASVNLSSQGIFVRAKCDGKRGTLRIGFSGRLGHSAGFKKARRELGQEASLQYKTKGSKHALASISRTEARLSDLNASRKRAGKAPVRKFAELGSIGFVKRSGGSSSMKLARGADNLGYANLVQVGQFIGVQYQGGPTLSPQHLGQLRAKGKTGGLAKGYSVARGKGFPLLPLEGGDAARIRAIVEAELGRMTEKLGLRVA